MYPNPALNTVSFSFEDDTRMQLTGSLYNILGYAVYSNITLDLESNDSVDLEVSSLPQGVYILQLRDEKGTLVSEEKLVKR